MLGVPVWGWIVIGGAALVVLAMWLPDLFKGGKWLMATVAPAAAPAAASGDMADFAALAQLQARYERLGCKEGTEAAKVMLQHFWHKGAA